MILVLSQGEKATALASSEGAEVVDETREQSHSDSVTQPELFEENFKELKKWVDVKSPRYGTLLVLHERRSGRLGTALKVIFLHHSSHSFYA